jgi:hypothetical protein
LGERENENEREGGKEAGTSARLLARSPGGSVLYNQREAFNREKGIWGREGGKESGTRLLVRWQRSLARPVVALARSFGR